MVEVPAVALRFVRAAPSAITLDFVLAGKEEAPKVERYELQYALAPEGQVDASGQDLGGGGERLSAGRR